MAPRSLESRIAERRVEAMRRDNERRAYRERLAGPTRTVIQSPDAPDRDVCAAAKRQRSAAFDAMGTRRS
ncbi:MAG: hypothetical protein GAK31_00284 [Stenotrophomonas maltophilia]|uniref:Uncharacterized protein n=1 Tax=Stenotrophomonas maltophilia TaxID=40324 RepID=A0A7V8FJ04_STEMA|nr:MAG: hypothetical protein GAK31_00284 [Stenotrophomonas maltophilia]